MWFKKYQNNRAILEAWIEKEIETKNSVGRRQHSYVVHKAILVSFSLACGIVDVLYEEALPLITLNVKRQQIFIADNKFLRGLILFSSFSHCSRTLH
jgi:hypothetical protein